MIYPCEIELARNLLVRWRYGTLDQRLYDETDSMIAWLSHHEKQTCHPEEATTAE